MVEWKMTEKPARNRRVRFSVRTLLIVVAVLSVLMGWIGTVLEQRRQEKRALGRIRRENEQIRREESVLDYFRKYDIHVVQRSGYPVRLTFFTGPREEELVHLKQFTRLESLYLTNINMTDAVLLHVRQMTGLKSLGICHMITDADLERLRPLTHLKVLDLGSADVSTEAIEELQKALPYCWIHHAVDPEPLIWFDVDSVDATTEAIEELQKAPPQRLIYDDVEPGPLIWFDELGETP